MLITGIVLQLLAGIMLGLPHIFRDSRLEDANERIKRLLLLPSRGRGRLRFLLIGALVLPVGLFIVAYLLVRPVGEQWHEVLGGASFGVLIAALIYLSLLRRITQRISGVKEPKELPDDAYFRAMLRGNLMLIPVLVGVGWLSSWGVSALSLVNSQSVPAVAILAPILVLAFVAGVSGLCAYMASAFVVLSGVSRLLSVMAKPDRILWILVLSLYVIGGALLIASASRS